MFTSTSANFRFNLANSRLKLASPRLQLAMTVQAQGMNTQNLFVCFGQPEHVCLSS